MINFTTISNVSNNETFGVVTWLDLQQAARIPHRSRAHTPDAAKRSSPLVAAHNGKTRNKAEAEANGLFWMLRADLDDAKGQTPETIAAALQEQGLCSFIIYSTLTHQPDAPRYRVFVELAEPVSFAIWADLQFALAELLGSDPCVGRPAQFMILPTTIKSTAEHYQYMIAEGDALTPSVPFWVNAMEQATNYQTAAAEVEQQFKQAAPRAFNENLIGQQVSIIDRVNAAYEWAELLEHYGYKRKGRNAWIAPESASGTAGVHVLASSTDGKERIFSHHQTDPAGHRLCDKFDLVAIRDFGGDSLKAVQEIAKELFPEIHAHNRREWARTKRDRQRQQIEAMREGEAKLVAAAGIPAKAISQPKGITLPLLTPEQMAEIMEGAQ
ncbi:hypothetical protein [Aeromonas caviae]|uniref:hypothetical protein n=1 Tax=Aeromonas caviae TaxID=648 RepID=UPI001FC89918|nr:hypothetical protein [Aeromonas caviae]